MKRVLSILLVTLLAFSAMSIMAVNATGNPTWSVTSASGDPGDTVTVDVNISNNPGVVLYHMYILYSKTDLELTKITNKNLMGTLTTNKAEGVLSMDADDNETANGTVATLEFKILEGAKTSEINLNVDQLRSVDWDTAVFTDIPCNVEKGTITVNSAAPTAKEIVEQAIATSTNVDNADVFGAANGFTAVKGVELLGVQENVARKGARFIAAASKDVIANANVTDYGFIFAKTSKNVAAESIANLTVDNAKNKFSCKGASNTLSGDYGDANADTAYKYFTAGIDNIPAGKTIVARFYVSTDYGTTYYAVYGNEDGIVYKA